MIDSGNIIVDKNSRELHGRTRSLLESAVLFGEFPPGQLLPSERKLATRYNVTRTTVRRSLSKLVDSGLLTYKTHVGHRVAPAIRNNKAVSGGSIGLVWNGMPTAAGLVDMEQQLAEAGHVLMLGASGVSGKNEDETIRRLAASGMAGLIITPARAGGESAELELWIRNGKPVVLHGHPGRWIIPEEIVRCSNRVDADNTDGMRQLFSHVAEKGHRSAAFISTESFTGSERFLAFETLAPEFGIEIKKSWNVENVEPTVDASSVVLAQLKTLGELPSLLVCSHYNIALAMIDAIKEAGLKCPEDISVVASSYAEFDGNNHDGITHVGWSGQSECGEMLRLLAKQFSGVDKVPEDVRIPMKLTEGRTVNTVNHTDSFAVR